MAGLSLSSALSLSMSPRAGGGAPPSPPVPVADPAGFALSAPYQPTISRTGSGTSSTFTTDYSEATRKALITPVNTYYVRLAGSNNNNGLTAGAPVRSLDLAVAMANASGVAAKINYEAAGLGATRPRFMVTNTQARSGQPSLNTTYPDALSSSNRPSVPIIFEPSVANGLGDSVLNVALPAFAATADPNIYIASGVLTNCVVDYLNQDTYGAPRRLAVLLTTPANTAAPWPEMNALWTLYSNLPERDSSTYALGVIYVSGTDTYIRTFDNRNPNGDTNLTPLSTAVGAPVFESLVADRRVYCEGLGFTGGSNSALFMRGQNGFRFRADFVRCRFVGGNGAGTLTMTIAGGTATDGVDVVAVQCAANGGNLDGFNSKFNSTLVTIDCIGDWNGWGTNGTNNGITMHETCRNLDINGSWRNNQDRSVHHVGNGFSWHIGAESGTRRGADATDISAPYAVNGNGNSGTRIMWLDNCTIFNGPSGAPQYNAEVWAGSTLNYANMPFTPGPNPAGWTGTFATYTP